MPQAMNILLADDHELLRDGLKRLLARLCESARIFEAADYDEVAAFARPGAADVDRPDIILLDINMPGMPGASWTRALRKVCDDFAGTPVVSMSGLEDTATVMDALHHGARGFLPKSSSAKSILAALRLVLDGETYVPPCVVNSVHPRTIVPAIMRHPANGVKEGPLSSRARQVLALLIEGKSNKRIAIELGVEEVTIKAHLRGIYRKLGATNRVEAVRNAISSGVLADEEKSRPAELN